jgi:drug/metabolite transporter (DMT)-like permease
MSAVALALVLTAAVIHAGWNLLVKQTQADRELLTWLALAMGGVLLGPAIVAAWHSVVAVWPFVIASAAAEAVYVLLLTAAYERGDLSVVYPIARGTAPLLLAVWTTVFLAQPPRAAGLAGICALGVGVVMVAWTMERRSDATGRRALSADQWADIGLTLGVALCISAYSVVDGAAMRRAPASAFATAAGYEGAVFWLGAAMTAPVVLRGSRRKRLGPTWARRWRRILLVGAAMAGGYVAVLVAFRLAPVAYVGATREVSIVLAAIAGWLVLGERFSALRLLGSVVIVLGILSIVRFG